MPMSAKSMRAQIVLMKPVVEKMSLDSIRKWQNRIGALGSIKERSESVIKEHNFDLFSSAWIVPKDERRQGVILYLHGGGYTCGDMDYAKAFGSVLALNCGCKVLAPAYRLAPEHPFPAALDDALTAYKYLLEKGYSPKHITLCGESAGGGLCYALCLKLREKGAEMPAGIIAISPWTDLTLSGGSYELNKEIDPSLTKKILEFYASKYTKDRKNPLVSPLFADVEDMPPSIIFVGGDEILLSDSKEFHQKLLTAGNKSQLVIAPDRWHAYILYGLAEDKGDMAKLNAFLSAVMAPEKKLRWMRLDNAAKIYPASRSDSWSNLFRVSATLYEDVDVEILRSALDVTVRRFPSISTRLRKGVFWYYLQQLSKTPDIGEESSYPLAIMSKKETAKSGFRVLIYKKRISIEFFHSLTDGNGGMIFLKTLLAEYLSQKYGIVIPAEKGVLGRLEEPSDEEMEDSFLKYSGKRAASRKENDAWRLSGTPEERGMQNLVCLTLDTKPLLDKAHEYKTSLTVFLCAVMMQALQNMQIEKIPQKKRKPIKIMIPVNLRNLFPSKTLRNFALYSTPEIDTRLGVYEFEEILKTVHHFLGLEVNKKVMASKIAANVNTEKLLAVKIMPLFIKNLVMKAVFMAVGERKSCLSLSNLGHIELPEEMMPYIDRIDFILSVQSSAPHNCSVISFKDKTRISFLRDIKESKLELEFFKVLRDLGLEITAESNRQEV